MRKTQPQSTQSSTLSSLHSPTSTSGSPTAISCWSWSSVPQTYLLSRQSLQSPRLSSYYLSVSSEKPLKTMKDTSKIKTRINNGRGYHTDKKEDCAGCHSEHSGPGADLTDLDENDFDHEETGYLLSGKHKNITQCRKCHSPSRVFPRKKTLSYLLNDSKCKSCHETPHPLIKENCGK